MGLQLQALPGHWALPALPSRPGQRHLVCRLLGRRGSAHPGLQYQLCSGEFTGGKEGQHVLQPQNPAASASSANMGKPSVTHEENLKSLDFKRL